jgi:hypothetical protein
LINDVVVANRSNATTRPFDETTGFQAYYSTAPSAAPASTINSDYYNNSDYNQGYIVTTTPQQVYVDYSNGASMDPNHGYYGMFLQQL